MRIWIILLLIIGLLHSVYIDPPFESVLSNNSQLVNTDLGIQYANNLTPGTPTVDHPFASAGADLLLLQPSINQRVSAEQDHDLIWSWAVNYPDALTGFTTEEFCPDEIELKFSSESRYGSITFTFRNSSNTIPLNQTSLFILSRPSLSSLSFSNGSEPLNIDLSATFDVTYDRKYLSYRQPRIVNGTFTGCEGLSLPSPDNVTFSKAYLDHIEYLVEAGDPSYFLLRPTLKEQWYKNNKFDVLVASRRQLYKSALLLDGVLIGNTQWRIFNISTDPFGLQSIYSINESNSKNLSIEIHDQGFLSTPIFGEENFSYVYLSDAKYTSIGNHSLEIQFSDDFGGNYSYQKEILSRSLNSEDSIDPSFKRPEFSLPSPEITFYVVSVGAIFLALVLLRLRPR
jgi:hypothetical protein